MISKWSLLSFLYIQGSANISVAPKQTLTGLTFPFDDQVTEALDSFKQQNLDYLQLVREKRNICRGEFNWLSICQDIDSEKELIQLSHSEANITSENIRKCLPENAGRYHIYRFKHDFNGDAIESVCK